jgi:hypothetical protein
VDSSNCSDYCYSLGYSFSTCDVTARTLSDGRTFHDLHCRSSPRLVCTDGRRPEGLRDLQQVNACCEVGALLAQMAHLEAASVPAFLRLADELAAHGAPEALVRAARRSAGDEVRHARVVGALARRYGAAVPEVEVAPFGPRSFEAMALENTVEGCVRETYSAVVTGWKARAAGDEEIRRAMEPIAEDELRHAELAWAVDAWASERLAPPARARLREARHEAFRALEREVSEDVPGAALIQRAGMPAPEQAVRLVQGLRGLAA